MNNKQELFWKIHGVRQQLAALNKVNYSGTFGHGRINHGDKEAKRAALLEELRKLETQRQAA